MGAAVHSRRLSVSARPPARVRPRSSSTQVGVVTSGAREREGAQTEVDAAKALASEVGKDESSRGWFLSEDEHQRLHGGRPNCPDGRVPWERGTAHRARHCHRPLCTMPDPQNGVNYSRCFRACRGARGCAAGYPVTAASHVLSLESDPLRWSVTTTYAGREKCFVYALDTVTSLVFTATLRAAAYNEGRGRLVQR